jgi:hypothetical protein
MLYNHTYKRFMKIRILAAVIIIILIAGGYMFFKDSAETIEQTNSNISPSVRENRDATKKVTIEKIDMEMTIPEDFIFSKEQQMNLTTNEPYAINFIAQNYKDNPTQVPNPYQLYGIYQWDTAEITIDEFKQADFMLLESTREAFMVDGLPAIRGVAAGERGRYTIYILKDGHQITLAADGSSAEHKQITDAIVETINFK